MTADELYTTYTNVCATLGREPTVDIEELSNIHMRARILLTEYLKRFPKSQDNAIVSLVLDKHTDYIAQIQDGQVRVGIIPKEMRDFLTSKGENENECKN